jgi:hypothetical protein
MLAAPNREEPMIASVHVADVGPRRALPALLRPPRPGAVAGLRHVDIGLTAPLSASVRPSPQLGRIGLVAFWDDDAALDRFLDGHPLAAALARGWRVRLAPLRLWGAWPGVPDDLPRGRAVSAEGPAVVLTLGRLRLTQARRFFRTSARAEGRVVAAPGLVWSTGLARPPFVATCSLWSSAEALTTYAYDRANPEHVDAIAADRARPFHHRSAFVRFRPYASEGHLDGRNPLAESWLAAA